MKTKYFIFNMVTVLICMMTAVTIPKLADKIKTNADTNDPIIGASGDNTADGEAESIISPTVLDEVKGDPVTQAVPEANTVQKLQLRATFLATEWGDKFWELSVWDAGSGTEIKSWTDIYAEWQTDKTVINTGGGNFDITSGGLRYKGSGGYSVTVTYSGMPAALSKAETTFP